MNSGPAYRYCDRELSWLSFNARVLQEAQNPDVPIVERLHFLAIFSSNLDEFFRVRVASLRSLLRLKKKKIKKLDFEPVALLEEIRAVVSEQQEIFGTIFRESILPELERRGLALIDESRLTEAQSKALHSFFMEEIRPHFRPVWMDPQGEPPFLKDKGLYLITTLRDPAGFDHHRATEGTYALIEIPSPPLRRFVEVPGEDGLCRVMFLDDMIRHFLPDLFPGYEVGASFAIKLSRDADLHLEDEFSGNLKDMIAKSLSKRETGVPTRFLYDQRMPQEMLILLKERLDLADEDLIEGWRYHNLNDFFSFPLCQLDAEAYAPLPPLPHAVLESTASICAAVREKDRLLSFPYQAFDYVVRFLDEAAEDPATEAIWITLYRVSANSAVIQALGKAARRGKRVTAVVEVKARFDEASNLNCGTLLEAAGVRVIYSVPGLKVHTKLALVARGEGDRQLWSAYLGTGNFNEKTARIYADHALLTSDPRLTEEARRIFAFIEGAVERPTFEHLLVAPSFLRKGFYQLIDYEIEQARSGKEARILAKMNSLEDRKMITRLYEASRAGVEIRLIVRGICCLVPGVPGQSENITVTSIVDRFLEHARVYVFHHGGDERIYLASADWMRRNLSRRIEVAFPVYDPDLRAELHAILDLQSTDNTRARIIDEHLRNDYVRAGGERVRAQMDTYRYFKAKVEAELKISG
ncbi:MAG: polyphosphate kinase 1 [Rhodothermales bacterium]